VSDQDISPEAKADLALEIGHLLFIDVVGYSKLMVNEQIELMKQLNRIVRATESFCRAEARKELIRLPTGDGMVLLFFHSPEEPVRCALEISQALRDQSHIQLRMGVHSGPVNQVLDVNDQINMAGAGINVGQRVMDCGDAGHILISKHVADDLAEFSHWRPCLYDLGECEVKHGLRLHLFNLARDGLGNPQLPQKLRRGRRWKPVDRSIVRPVKPPSSPRLLLAAAVLLSLLAIGLSFLLFVKGGSVLRSGGAEALEKSIAVLPFENRSDDNANAYFADAIQDEVLTRLSKIADLKVISRTSTQQYKTKPEHLSVIARELGVTHILEGSVQKNGGVVRVNVQLIRAANDAHIWADTFDRSLTDVFSVESEIARTIADQLRAKMTGQEQQAIATKPTDNSEAYDAYLRGLAYTLKAGSSGANARNSQKYFHDAVRLDSKFALAWALLSYTDAHGYLTMGLDPTTALREEARQAADTALTLQPDLGEARLAQGEYHYACLKDYDTAVRYFEQARPLLPNDSRIPEVLAYVARRRGRWDRSESYFKEAELLDPRNVRIMLEHAFLYDSRRQFPEARRKCEQILDITPDDLNTLLEEVDIALAEGDLSRAGGLLAQIHPTSADTEAVWRKIYHAVLERRPTNILPWLSEMLAKRDSASGNFSGDVFFWAGWARQMAGDHAAAEQTWREARDQVDRLLKTQPNNQTLIGYLALFNMALGDRTEALSLADRAIAVNPIEKDAISGPTGIEILARVAAQSGEHDRAIAALEKLLSIPYSGPIAVPLTPALLRLDPMFDPLRDDKRFQKLSAGPAPK
jgi:TolB-like protein/class 3 adenylate cyclase/Tfp pilus assembly protein PilF